MKNRRFWGPGAPLRRSGAESRKLCQKLNFGTKRVTLLGALFRAFRYFLTLDFSFIFEMTSDSELCALWCRKGAKKEVSGKPFRNDFEVSGESENEAAVQTPAPFSRC